MSNPWLDGLSEEWVPQARESSPSLPSPVSSVSHDSVEIKAQPRSRIPRFTNSPGILPSSKKPTDAPTSKVLPGKRRSALAQRTQSDNNILSNAAPPETDANDAAIPRTSHQRSLSTSSIQSGTQPGTVAQKPRDASPTKNTNIQDTPEWKRRLIQGKMGYGDQKDLFSPMGLENIFQQPNQRAMKAKHSKRGSSFLKDEDFMPSSPPPWPSRKPTATAGEHLPCNADNDTVDSINEKANEREDSSEHLSNNQFSEPSIQGHNEDQSDAEASQHAIGISNPSFDGFTPVYVQRHSTRDGRIDYVAVDLSKSQLERMRELDADPERMDHSESIDNRHFDGTDTSSFAKLRSEVLPDDLPVGTPDQPTLGEFVSIKRGGLSDEESFRRRRLSASPLGRKLPSLSHSLDPDGNNEPISPGPLSADKLPVLHPFPKDAEPPSPPKTPGPASESKMLSPERPTSSGSPLKLFGNYDTFTMKKLQRRMSQIEDDIQPEDPVPIPGQKSSQRSRSSTGSPVKRGLEVRLPSVEEASLQQLSSPVNGQRPTNQSQKREMSNSSQFGRGELDEFPFPSDLGVREFRSSLDDLDHSPERDSHPEHSQSPDESPPQFRFNVDDTSLSKHTIKSWTTTATTRRNSITMPKSPRTDARSNDSDSLQKAQFLDGSEGKRAPPSPFKNPTPKRRRTLVAAEVVAVKEVASDAVQKSHGMMQSILKKKRKDSRLDASRNAADPNVLAKRHILRPRNPTPSQRRKREIQAEILDATDEYISSSPGLQAVQEHLDSPSSYDLTSAGEEGARALASEVAAYSIKSKQAMKDESRKRSVTTQDFLDEARLIMDHIRARGRPNSALESLEDSAPASPNEKDYHLAVPVTPLSFSRPPSRDGAKGGWRNPGTASVSPRIASHLRRYEEKEDEDFMSGGFRTFDAVHHDGDDLFGDQDLNTHIDADGLTGQFRERAQSDAFGDANSRRSSNTDSNHGSRPSTMDSSLGKTHVTNASRRSDNVAILAPEAVAHLIPTEIAGMSYDPERNAWVKRKSPKKQPVTSTDVSGLTGSEEDALRSISDLTVDANEERDRMSQYPPDLPANTGTENRIRDPNPSFVSEKSMQELSDKSGGTARPKTREGAELPAADSSSAPSKLSTNFTASGPQNETRATSISVREANNKAKQGPHVPPALDEIPSSPVTEDLENDTGFFDSHNMLNVIKRSPQFEDGAVHSSPFHPQESVKGIKSISMNPLAHRGRPSIFSKGKPGGMFSSINNREVSIIECSTPQRQMRFQVSVSGPLQCLPCGPAEQAPYVTPAGQSPYVDATFMLSDLPEFTVNQVDERELPGRALVMRNGKSAVRKMEDRFANGIVELVKAMQDAEPDELFWDDLRRLALRGGNVPSLHMLDEMCYRLEELDVSSNLLSQLSGAPSTIRRLDVHNNCLTSLTSWGHLLNLQYLDISGNCIDNLKGISPLVHLRELQANDNQIESLEGLAELDGLMKLGLKGNKVRTIDFEGSSLDRLEELDVSYNQLRTIRSLSALPALKVLNLDGNGLMHAPTDSQVDSNPNLRYLSLNCNALEELDVYAFPGLEALYLDSNNLPSISGIDHLKHLKVLSARAQVPLTHAAPFDVASFLANPDVHELYLSANSISSFPITNHLLNLKRLELASCGLQSLPTNFGQLAPNLRFLNLNFNALKDLRPVLNIKRLETLHVVENRLARLRKNVMVLARTRSLKTLDLRGNPFTVGFYDRNGSEEVKSLQRRDSICDDDDDDDGRDSHILPPGCPDTDMRYRSRLDEDTQLRRRVYEILLAQGCKKLERLDGLSFKGSDVSEQDGVWQRLVDLGVLRKSGVHDGGFDGVQKV
ncbi:hypothetical protein K490DRAFT_38212 [Saccharata proteae CBS 121410]|uniref:L domain-like protein n=1 Tax=Saccharata proteae CBS 121410 TaxID=1314787 RepID=A0A6A5YDI8_9PEZI|nr:hypothetical protein K490DRAFT_38212 [Saccharata proteae CBS 121410]